MSRSVGHCGQTNRALSLPADIESCDVLRAFDKKKDPELARLAPRHHNQIIYEPQNEAVLGKYQAHPLLHVGIIALTLMLACAPVRSQWHEITLRAFTR